MGCFITYGLDIICTIDDSDFRFISISSFRYVCVNGRFSVIINDDWFTSCCFNNGSLFFVNVIFIFLRGNEITLWHGFRSVIVIDNGSNYNILLFFLPFRNLNRIIDDFFPCIFTFICFVGIIIQNTAEGARLSNAFCKFFKFLLVINTTFNFLRLFHFGFNLWLNFRSYTWFRGNFSFSNRCFFFFRKFSSFIYFIFRRAYSCIKENLNTNKQKNNGQNYFVFTKVSGKTIFEIY